ncbi:putative Surfeit locus protein 6 [Monocercomonoides exilis]|uniref:putative Surfeit locus protein 6 n=1 Tax=Monocercomonoides exilis TaxID=2049356 RepID=UPI00355A6852|nr:putative Surfeit locus protein 6 [Monocercomonoides exilis]|eukprot:MONOS_5318.1-p1 / transcript=MONOS_5318.1 / gene=MONOS_5318 / organism=Monocercomonoides_exilis_PA203 / gene_product=unspecified product / transcript_product=unspecified product / location=Mono_scaffold00153:52665-53826(+) / protein_length=246 / sequence_SO=supercontig / SO=protein_coding / is_pseudo=false
MNVSVKTLKNYEKFFKSFQAVIPEIFKKPEHSDFKYDETEAEKIRQEIVKRGREYKKVSENKDSKRKISETGEFIPLTSKKTTPSNKQTKKSDKHAKGKQMMNEEEDNDFTFAAVKDGDPEPDKLKKGKSKKLLLRDAMKKQKKADRLKETENGRKILAEQSWKRMESLAEGKKLKDDPKLIEKAIKRKHQEKERSAKRWKAKLAQQKKEKDEAMEKKKRNIEWHNQHKKDKKTSKVVQKKRPARK